MAGLSVGAGPDFCESVGTLWFPGQILDRIGGDFESGVIMAAILGKPSSVLGG